MLEDTLVIWGVNLEEPVFHRGLLPKIMEGTIIRVVLLCGWLVQGVKKGFIYGKTDDFSYNVVENPVHVHDFQATLLHLMGLNHEKLTFKHQGRRYRLTDVHGKVVDDLLM